MHVIYVSVDTELVAGDLDDVANLRDEPWAPDTFQVLAGDRPGRRVWAQVIVSTWGPVGCFAEDAVLGRHTIPAGEAGYSRLGRSRTSLPIGVKPQARKARRERALPGETAAKTGSPSGTRERASVMSDRPRPRLLS
jgi:hypothetical protein